MTQPQVLRLTGDFQVPDDLVLINRKELEKLQASELDETVRGDKKWLKHKLGVLGDDKLNEILDTYRDKLDMDRSKKGMIHFPRKQGDPLIVIKKLFSQWLDDNARRVYGGK